MRKPWTVLLVVCLALIVGLVFVGCEEKAEKPAAPEHPAGAEHPGPGEHPVPEKPTAEHPSAEHPK